MTVRLGTVAAIGFDDFPPGEWLSCFRQLGCQTVQAYRNQDGNVTIEQMKEAIAAGQMPCDSLHGVYGEPFDPSAPKEEDRQSAADTFKAEGEIALELGGPLVVVHCSTIRTGGISPAERERRISQLKKTIVELGRFGQYVGVQYAFENLPGYHAVGYDVAELAGILSDLAVPNTGMCLDTGHAHMVGDAAEAIMQTNRQIIYVHLSDNSGNGDDHDMPTYGSLDTDATARALRRVGYHGTMMLEVFYSTERLRKLIDEGCAERLARIVALANGQDEQ